MRWAENKNLFARAEFVFYAKQDFKMLRINVDNIKSGRFKSNFAGLFQKKNSSTVFYYLIPRKKNNFKIIIAFLFTFVV